ncbi:MAG: hypothetical protein WHU94_12920 [Thermogemmata sp.]|jgi:hypothetical protein
MSLAAFLWVSAITTLAVLVYFLFRWLPRLILAIRLEQAQESLRLQQQRLEEMVLRQGMASGKPRGLKWRRCQFQGEPLWLHEEEKGQVAVLVPVTVEFETHGETESWEGHPVEEPRRGVVLFFFRRGEWESAGRVLFNLTPQQAAEQLSPPWRIAPILPSSATSASTSS